MDMFNALLADKKEAREFNASALTPGKVVDMVTCKGATWLVFSSVDPMSSLAYNCGYCRLAACTTKAPDL